jgi:hypothetical protein
MTHQDLVLGYEGLRAQVLSQSAELSRGLGIVLLMRQGLLAWMKAWSHCTPPVGRPTQDPSPTEKVIPLDLRANLALILAEMALGHYQEVER